MDGLLTGLRAAAEPTRLRLLALCSRGDLAVSEITQVLGQSQPRVSRHLKLMCEAGLLDRFREGAWVFYRLAQQGEGARVARRMLDLLPPEDPLLVVDRQRLDAVKRARAEAAASYFRDVAPRWNDIRSLHVDDAEVEAALAEGFSTRPIGELLDIGTGTGRILEVLAPQARHAVGIDGSREMLAVARARLDSANLANCSVRQADMYHLPFPPPSFDTVTIHQVLHYADDPAAAVAEAARVLRPGGVLAVVDFAPHDLEELRTRHNHRRLGFADSEVMEWCRLAGLQPSAPRLLPGQPLTVVIWLATKHSEPIGEKS